MIDYKTHQLFKHIPGSYLLAEPLDGKFVIRDITYFHANAIGIKREDIIGRDVFEVFPDNPTQEWKNSEYLLKSFQKVVRTKHPDVIPEMRYDVPREGGGFERRYWRVENYPVIDEETGEVGLIINSAIDITTVVRMMLEQK